MERLFIIWMFGLCVWPATDGASIKQLIEQREDLVQLRNYLKNSPLLRTLGEDSGRRYTFFAPNDEAFGNVPPGVREKYLGTAARSPSSAVRDELDEIFRYHIVHTPQNEVFQVNDLGDSRLETQAFDGSYLFFTNLNNEQFVNGARIVSGDLEASNGVVHIIDHFFYEEPQPHKAFWLVEKFQQNSLYPTRIFHELLEEYMDIPSPGSASYSAAEWLKSTRVTAFIPHDRAFDGVNLEALKKDITLLKQVVESHVIPNHVYHTNIIRRLMNQPLPAVSGAVIPKKYGRSLYVSNFCAQGNVTEANVTVENGVVHLIDGVLGYIYNDLYDKLKELKNVRRFSDLTRSSEALKEELIVTNLGEEIAEKNMLTVFAPVDRALDNVDLQKNGPFFENALKMHVVRSKLELDEITNATVRDTLRPGYEATFTRIEEGDDVRVYVDVNNVRGLIVEGDICTQNGIIHKVDHVVGTPTDNIYTFLEDSDNLRSLRKKSAETGVKQLLKGEKTFTLFAPLDTGFEKMRAGEDGTKLFKPAYERNLKAVLHRHLVDGELLLDDTIVSTRTVETYFGDSFGIKREGDGFVIKFAEKTVRVVRPNLRMTNGIIHEIDTVLYEEGNPNAAEWTLASGSQIPVPFFSLLVISLAWYVSSVML